MVPPKVASKPSLRAKLRRPSWNDTSGSGPSRMSLTADVLTAWQEIIAEAHGPPRDQAEGPPAGRRARRDALSAAPFPGPARGAMRAPDGRPRLPSRGRAPGRHPPAAAAGAEAAALAREGYQPL